jgi:hypothetical protein
MSSKSDLVDKLAQSIADGDSINWDEIDKLPADDELRRLVELFRVVANVAEVHRSPADDSSPKPDQITTKPRSDHLSPGAPSPSGSSAGLGQWGHLLLLRKIGEGAFGEVFQAHDTWLDHPVALKLFKSKVAGRDPSHRILHEARKLARIRHPNVVSVHGADSHDGQVGFWMDFIEGVTLADLVASGRLSAGEATSIGQEVCRALAAVHHAEIVHRDIKAQNVMRASDGGRIILMDFGAGEFINVKTATSRRQGTPLYLAPEIFAGENASIQSDIYAVGVLLYYLVTGGFPVSASSVADLMDAHKRGVRRHLRDRRPDLPSSFVSIVERAIDPDPARRFASAGEMESALTGEVPRRVVPIDPDKFVTRERTALEKVEFVGLGLAITGVTIELLGLVASRMFEVVLGIHQDFVAGPKEYFSVGARSLWPFVIFWVAGFAVLGILAGMRPLFRAPVDAIQRQWTALTGSLDGETLGAIVLLSGTGCWIAISWACWSLFAALDHLSAAIDGPVDVSALSSGAISLHRAHSTYSAYLSFLLVLAVWKWFPRFEKRSADPSRVRLLRWATVVVAFMVVVTAVAPRRFIWDTFELVIFENQRAFVIGASHDELLLYSPQGDERRRWRVPRNTAALQRTGTTARLFDSN